MRFRLTVLIAVLASLLPSSSLYAQTPGSGKRLYANSWALVVGINRYRKPTLRHLFRRSVNGNSSARRTASVRGLGL